MTVLQGVAGLGFTVALLVRAFDVESPGRVLGEAGYFAVLSAGVAAAGVALVIGRTWARSPAVVVQLLLLGVAWYAYGPSGQQLAGSLLGIYCAIAIVLLFTGPARAWALGLDDEDEGSIG
jgi:hypothetical protein